MTKKILIASFILIGFTIGTVGMLAQETISIQPAVPATPVPTTPVPHLPQPSATPDVPVPFLSQQSQPSIDSSAIPEMNLRQGMKNSRVIELQKVLKSLGYFPADIEVSENFGPRTREAIRRFQQANNLPPTGFFGPATRTSLRNKIKERKIAGEVIDRNVDIACMKNAVEKRENTLLTIYNAYSQKIRTTYETRRIDLLAAWSIQNPEERHTAIRVAWDKFRENIKNTRKEWNQNNKTIWSQFAQEAKKCRASVVETSDLEKIEVSE